VTGVALIVLAVVVAGDTFYIGWLHSQLAGARRKDAEP
jgi:hypothetical protein